MAGELVSQGGSSNAAMTPAGDYNYNLPYYWPQYQWWPTPITTTIIQQPVLSRCAWCQGLHLGKCERLKEVVYRPDGTVERVEFFP